MPFDQPNLSDAMALNYPFLSRLYEVDFHTIGAAAGGRCGVISGGEVTEAGSPAMSVELEAGRDNFNGVPVDYSADTIVLTAADGTDPRWDVVTVDSNGDAQLYTGTADANPEPPTPAAVQLGTEVCHALVYVPASDTAILQNQIKDRRIMVMEPLGESQWTTLSAPSNVDRASTTVASADPVLTFAMAPSTTYRLRWVVQFFGNPANAVGGATGVKAGFGGPASPSFIQLREEMQSANAAETTVAVGGAQRFITAYDTAAILSVGSRWCRWSGDGVITNGSNSGDFALWWAQSTSLANPTRRLLGSYLEYEVV